MTKSSARISSGAKKNAEDNLFNHSGVLKNDYLFKMSLAPRLDEDIHWFQMLPASFFTAVVIMITRMAAYERPMEQFFWSGGSNQLNDFFSYFKMIAILTCAIFALVLLLYRLFTQSFFIKRSFVYIPMAAYSILVLLSYFFSEYKIFALWGWNDRFEGTISLLAYIFMLFYIINSVNTEKNVKWIVYPLALTSGLLGVLGLTQALGHDFFRTTIGKKFITPSWFWDQLDNLNFTFQNKEIYQTVYNINYVSFYLTLLIPLFGMLFIKAVESGKGTLLWKKIALGSLLMLLLYNLIGSASSGGILGMFMAVLMGIIVLNKRIIQWKKSVIVLVLLTLIIGVATYDRFAKELFSSIDLTLGTNTLKSQEVVPEIPEELQKIIGGDTASEQSQQHLDYINTSGSSIEIGLDGDSFKILTDYDDPASIKVTDSYNKYLKVIPTNVSPIYKIDDARFNCTVRLAQDESMSSYLIIGINGEEWPFSIKKDGTYYYNGVGGTVDLRTVPSTGFKDNGAWGNGRGYIWSRTLPLLKDTILIGHGADTYCIYFPQDDYVGKYNSNIYNTALTIVVDKPHNMYLGAAVGTGIISVLALLVLWGYYIIQSFRIYRKSMYTTFFEYVGAGIFFGIFGFLVTGLVNDSSVSVMPMFYGLLGTGIAINLILKRHEAGK